MTVPADAEWKAERAQIEDLIISRARGEVPKLVSPRQVADEMGFPYPVKDPARSVEEVAAAVDKLVAAEVEAALPAAKEAEFVATAEGMYKPVKVGESIEFTLRGGVGPNARVAGRVMRVSAERLQVGTRWIATRDVEDDVLARLLPEVRTKKIEEYVERETRRYRVQRDRVAEEARTRLTPKEMKAAGYVPMQEGKKTVWVPAKAVYDAELERRQKVAAETARKRLEPELFKASQYQFYENEWMPRAVVVKLQAEREAARLAAQAQAELTAAGGGQPGIMPAVPMAPDQPPMVPPPGAFPPGMVFPPGMAPPGAGPVPVPPVPPQPVPVVPAPAPVPPMPVPAPEAVPAAPAPAPAEGAETPAPAAEVHPLFQ
jgi:hypothetical protein